MDDININIKYIYNFEIINKKSINDFITKGYEKFIFL